MKRLSLGITAAVIAASVLVGVHALSGKQAPAVKRTVLLKQDSAATGREVVMAAVELPPGAREGRHTHPAEVYAFVNEGAMTVDVEGEPTRTYKAGEVFTIPQGTIHEGRNDGTTPLKLSVVFLAEKGKPLTTPAQ